MQSTNTSAHEPTPSRCSVLGLDLLSFLMADVRERDRLRQRLNKPPFKAMLETIENNRRTRIRKGRENHILHDIEILSRRKIQTDETYSLWLKVLSNFAHFSALSHQWIMETTADWEKGWPRFLTPALCVASFAAEAIEAFFETFPQTRKLLNSEEQAAVANLRSWLRKETR